MEKSPFQRYGVLVLLVIFLTAVSACEKKAEVVADMVVSIDWNPPEMPLDKNPEIQLTGVPKATHRFSVELVDLDMKTFNHGGGKYIYNGSPVIPAGAVDGNYIGPHPPPGIVHQYEFTIKALDASGVVIGEGRLTRQYPEDE